MGEEISKTFDSSQLSEDANASGSPLKEQGDLSATPVVTEAAPPSSRSRSPEMATAGDQLSTPPTGAGQMNGQGSSDGGGWGQWENQPLMATKTKNREVCMYVYHCSKLDTLRNILVGTCEVALSLAKGWIPV